MSYRAGIDCTEDARVEDLHCQMLPDGMVYFHPVPIIPDVY